MVAREVPRPGTTMLGGEGLDGLLVTSSKLTIASTRHLIDCHTFTLHWDRQEDLINHLILQPTCMLALPMVAKSSEALEAYRSSTPISGRYVEEAHCQAAIDNAKYKAGIAPRGTGLASCDRTAYRGPGARK